MMALLPTMADHEVAVSLQQPGAHEQPGGSPDPGPGPADWAQESFSPGIMADLQAALSVMRSSSRMRLLLEANVGSSSHQQKMHLTASMTVPGAEMAAVGTTCRIRCMSQDRSSSSSSSSSSLPKGGESSW